MQFDVIIPTYNNLQELKKCLQGFEYQTLKDFRVFVCVDGSTDGTFEWLAKQNFSFKTEILAHPNKENRGRAATRNLALSYLNSKYILFIDSDLIPAQQLLEEHAKILLSNPSAVSQGNIQYQDIDNLWTHYESNQFHRSFTQEYRPWTKLLSGNLAMATELFKSVKGFDNKGNYYGGEDSLLGWKIMQQENHYILVNNQLAIVNGILGKSLQEGLTNKSEFAATNLNQLLQVMQYKHAPSYKLHLLKTKKAKYLYKTLKTIRFYFLTLRWLSGKKGNSLTDKLIHLLVFYVSYEGFHHTSKKS